VIRGADARADFDVETIKSIEASPPRHDSARAVVAIGILVAAASAALHFLALATIPGLNGDEAYYGVLALLEDPQAEAGISDVGTWSLPLIRGAIALWGTTPLALRVWPALFATMTPILAYGVVARSGGAVTGLLVAAPLIAHPALLVFGRIGWDNSLIPLLVVVLIVASRALFRSPGALTPIVAGAVVAGLALRLHPTAFVMAVAWLACVAASQALGSPPTASAAQTARPARLPDAAARVSGAVARVALATVVLLLVALPVIPLLASFAAGDAAAVAVSAPRPPKDLAAFVTGALAIEWVTGVRPFPGATGMLLAITTAALAFAGIALGLRSRDAAERGSSLLCGFVIALGIAALARTDLAAPGSARYALAFYPCVAWALGRAPELVARSSAGRRHRARAIAAHIAATAVVFAGLWGWQHAFWTPLRDDARAAEPAFVPGEGSDPKQLMIARIADRIAEMDTPSVAIVAMNWDLYHAARYFTRRRYPVLRVDVHDVREFEPRFRALASSRAEIYFLVYEQSDGAAAGLARRLETLIDRPVRVERDVITDRLDRPLIAIYRFAPRELESIR
jgi:hypothetical protein